jgi:hypothetical protein
MTVVISYSGIASITVIAVTVVTVDVSVNVSVGVSHDFIDSLYSRPIDE